MTCIEGIPFIIRFKTQPYQKLTFDIEGIEGIPFIIRFKTISAVDWWPIPLTSIEGIPFIIRFKT